MGKWRCGNNSRCIRYEFDAITLTCNMFEESKDDLSQSTPFDVFDMRDHKKNRNNEGDCKWRCDNNYRCARYEYDASTLFCKLFEKSKDESHQSAPFDVFDMRDHPKNRDHEGDCKWRCDNADHCARYEFDATTLICKLFEKYPPNEDDKDTSSEEQALVEKKSKSGFEHNSDKNAKDEKGNKKSKQGLKFNSDEGNKKTEKDHEAKKSPDLVSDKHDKHSKKEKNENKKTNEEPEAVAVVQAKNGELVEGHSKSHGQPSDAPYN